MTLSVGRLLAIMWRAVPRSSMTTRAFLATPSSASKTPYFLQIFPDLSASRGILHLPSRPPSALQKRENIQVSCLEELVFCQIFSSGFQSNEHRKYLSCPSECLSIKTNCECGYFYLNFDFFQPSYS